jgi:hypothetical protein
MTDAVAGRILSSKQWWFNRGSQYWKWEDLNTHQNISLPHPTEIGNEGLFLPYADVCTCFLLGSGSEERGF